MGFYGNKKTKILLNKSNVLECKIGKTTQRPRSRRTGGDYSNKGFDMRLIVRVKANMESLLYKALKNKEYITFKDGSEERFVCPPQKWLEVEDIFMDTVKFYRQSF